MSDIARRVLALLLIVSSASAWAQAYPDRALRLVVGFPPGGSGDFLARIIADELAREIGQPVVVDNKPGAASNIAAENVARAAPDGYTIQSEDDRSRDANAVRHRFRLESEA